MSTLKVDSITDSAGTGAPDFPNGIGSTPSFPQGISLDPANMTDANATMLGLKSYAHGTSYNGGNSPTITYVSGGGSITSVDDSAFIPYKLQNGSWRLKFSMTLIVSAATRTDFVVSVAGVTAKNTPSAGGLRHPIFGTGDNSGANYERSGWTENSGNLGISHASAATSSYIFGGDIPLESKPTWAY